MGGVGSPDKIRHLMNEITMQRHAIEQRIADVDIELGAGADLIAKMMGLDPWLWTRGIQHGLEEAR